MRENWLSALAICPLIRVVVLAEPLSEMSRIQAAERYLWLSSLSVEAIVIIIAIRDGFRTTTFVQTLAAGTRLLIGAWLVALGIATLRAPYFGYAVRSALEWLLHGMFAISVWYLAHRNRAAFAAQFHRFSRILPAVTAIAGLIVVTLVYSIGLSSDYPFGTELPGFAHIRHTGYFFAPAMALCLGGLAMAPLAPRNLMLLLTLNIALCLWFGSRGPFFALFVGLVAGALLFHEFRRWRFWAFAVGALCAGTLLSVIVPSPKSPAFNAVRRLLSGSADPSEFSSGRTDFWIDTAKLIVERPLFGYGGGQFQSVSSLAAHTYRHPHNFIPQVLFDWGLVGGGAFLGLLLLTAAIAMKARHEGNSASKIGLFGAACMIAFAGLDGILFYPFTIAITALLIAVATLAQAPADQASTPLGRYQLRARPTA